MCPGHPQQRSTHSISKTDSVDFRSPRGITPSERQLRVLCIRRIISDIATIMHRLTVAPVRRGKSGPSWSRPIIRSNIRTPIASLPTRMVNKRRLRVASSRGAPGNVVRALVFEVCFATRVTQRRAAPKASMSTKPSPRADKNPRLRA